MKLELKRSKFGPANAGYNSQRSWTFRESTLITLSDSAHTGLGEVTPLPGFSRELLTQAETALMQLVAAPAAWSDSFSFLLESGRADHVAAVVDWLRDTEILRRLPASARFGFETAVLDYWCNRTGLGLSQALAAAPSQPAGSHSSAALLPIHQSGWEAVLSSLLDAKTSCLKVKVGLDVPLELETLDRLTSTLAGRATLRLDANRSLSIQQMLSFARLNPEFIEEPVATSELALALPEASQAKLGIALDESLLELSQPTISAWLERRWVSALVLKPMLLGGVVAALDWAELARRYGAEAIYSHLFDGSVAREMYLALADATGSERCCSGLGTHPALELWQTEAQASAIRRGAR